MNSNNEIALLTTVSNWDLYNQSSRSFPGNINIYAIDGRDGFYGLRSLIFSLNKLKPKKYKWLVMVDEDAVFSSVEELFSLINYMGKEKFVAAGMRDGGILKWRNKNPHSINTFFCVLDLEEIYKIYDPKEILRNQYIDKNEFSGNLGNINYDNYQQHSLFEEYYCFFFWLLRNNKRILYLNAKNPFENETTALMNHRGEVFLYHAWYSRFYGKDKEHTQRIKSMLELGEMNDKSPTPKILKNPTYRLKFLAYKYYRRLRRKLKKQ